MLFEFETTGKIKSFTAILMPAIFIIVLVLRSSPADDDALPKRYFNLATKDQSYSNNLHRKLVAVHPFPDLSLQSKEEAKYLKFHKCVNAGEVYSASYLITKEHLLLQNTAYNLTWVFK